MIDFNDNTIGWSLCCSSSSSSSSVGIIRLLLLCSCICLWLWRHGLLGGLLLLMCLLWAIM